MTTQSDIRISQALVEGLRNEFRYAAISFLVSVTGVPEEKIISYVSRLSREREGKIVPVIVNGRGTGYGCSGVV